MAGVSGDDRFTEVGDRCFVGRYREWDVNVGLVVGDGGALVVDTRGTLGQGAQALDDVRQLFPLTPVRWVVNTHEHFDHTFGNGAFPKAVVHAHENAAAGLAESAARIKRLIRADPSTDPDLLPGITAEVLQEVLDTEPRPPDATFSTASVIDLGNRQVELSYPGRGHTDGDIVARVPNAEVIFAGDLVEESGPPAFGPDSFPLEWAGSLGVVLDRLSGTTVVVPGHGRPVDRAFTESQRRSIAEVAALIRSLAESGVPPEAALAEGARSGWPYDPDRLVDAVRRGYAHLGILR